MLLCLSRPCTLAYLDHLGKGYDAAVLEWKSNIEEAMISSEVDGALCFFLCSIVHFFCSLLMVSLQLLNPYLNPL